MAPPETLYRHLDFDDVDALGEAVRDWHLEFEQLERGSFRGLITQVGRDGWVAGRAELSRATEQNGLAPRGMRTVVITGTDESSMRWRSHEVDGSNLMVFPEGGELHAVGDRRFHIFTLTFDPTVLAETMIRWGVPAAESILDRSEVLRAAPEALAAFRRVLAGIIRGGEGPGIGAIRDLDPVRMLASVLMDSPIQRLHRRRCTGDRIFAEAGKILRADLKGEIPISRLAVHLHVSPRTLDSAFLKGLGVTPGAYRKVLRLNAVHRMLRRSDGSKVLVKDVAREMGFSHLSQFAADYRAHFGVLPSTTLRTGSKHQ